MKKFISLILDIMLIFFLCAVPVYAATPQSVSVYITVTDITDADNPFNVLADRIHLAVPYIDLSQESSYVFNPDGLLIKGSLAEEEKITYLHAIYALHKLVYGNDLVSHLYMDGDGDITLFFDKIVGTILYQNNDGIFDKPQCIELADGDEINICLYNYGHSQQVAIFDELSVTAQRNEDVTLHLKQYFEAPEEPMPIAGAQLTDGDGIYLTDSQGNIAMTNSNGAVTFRFSEGGLHRVSTLPEIGYYLDTGEEEEKETSKPEEPTRSRFVEAATKYETRTVTYDNSINGWYNLLDETAENYLDDAEFQAVLLDYYEGLGETPDPTKSVYLCTWDDEEETEEPLTRNAKMIVRSSYEDRIVRFPVITYDEPQPMVTYTIPFANINIDTTFNLNASLAINKQDGYSTIYIDYRNSDLQFVNGVAPAIKVGRFDKQGRMIGWVGDRHYNYTNSDGDTFEVKGNQVACHIINCVAGQEVTCIVYNISVDDSAALDNDTVAYINQYTPTENGTINFTFNNARADADYKIVVNKGGNSNAVSKIIHIFSTQATKADTQHSLNHSTIDWYTGEVAFQFNNYYEDIDDDPDNDTVYKLFCWDWYGEYWMRPLCPSITMTPPAAQRNNDMR